MLKRRFMAMSFGIMLTVGVSIPINVLADENVGQIFENQVNNVTDMQVDINMEEDSIDIVHSGQRGDLFWEIDSEGCFTLTGEGDYDGNMDDMEWLQYAEEIRTAKINVVGIESLHFLFDGCVNLTSVDFCNLDTSNVGTMKYMFNGCKSLITVDLTGFNTSNVVDMQGMFQDCSNLKSLDLSNFDTSNVDNMSSMFSGCESLTTLNLGSFNTSNVYYMNSMFANCKKFK